MLIDFSVENFRSFKEKVTFSMELGITSDKSLLDNVTQDNRFLKSAAVYGANASGKSNLIKAVNFVRQFVIHSAGVKNTGDIIPVKTFAFDDDYVKKPAKFELHFIYKNIKYYYTLCCDRERVVSESLFYWPKGRKSKIFEREGQNFTFTRDKAAQQEIAKRTAPNKSYMDVSNQFNCEQTKDAYEWFKYNFRIDKSGNGWPDLFEEFMRTDSDMKANIISDLKIADMGITDIIVNDKPHDISGLPEQIQKFILSKIKETSPSEVCIFDPHEDKVVHSYGNGAPITLDEESEGTQKYLSYIAPWLDSLEEGYTLIVDEMQNSLHPLLARKLIEMFHDPELNKNNAQLIFATHDATLLDLSFMRRDQIWFTEKNPKSGATDLYCLSDVNGIRSDENIQKGYLQGRYGAIPFIGGI